MSVDLDALTARFTPISLAELERRAALQTRTDNKYILDLETFARVGHELVRDYLALEIDGRRVSVYDTVYFDTPSLLSFSQHRQGRRRRFKCRTRLYGNGGPCFFEVKLKNGRDETVKRRTPIALSDHGLFTERMRAFLDGELQRAYGCPAPARLHPTVRSLYARLTLVGGESVERVTCDLALGFSAGGADRKHIRRGRVLLETKSEHGNGQADRVLRRLGERPVGPCSKYCVGVALARPELACNAFRRILRRHFDLPRHELPLRPRAATA